MPVPDPKWNVSEQLSYLEQYHKHSNAVMAILPLLSAKGTANSLAPHRKVLLMTLVAHKHNADIVQQCIKCITTAGVTTDLARPLVSVMKAQNSNRTVQLVLLPVLAQMNSDKAAGEKTKTHPISIEIPSRKIFFAFRFLTLARPPRCWANWAQFKR